MKFQVVVPKKVQKELNKIPATYRQKIIVALTVLAQDPYSGKKLEGKFASQWSYRVWPYRIIYEIKKTELVVLIIRINHRQEAYKG